MKSSASRSWGALLLYRGTAPPSSFLSSTQPVLPEYPCLIRGFLSKLLLVPTEYFCRDEPEDRKEEGKEREIKKKTQAADEKSNVSNFRWKENDGDNVNDNDTSSGPNADQVCGSGD